MVKIQKNKHVARRKMLQLLSAIGVFVIFAAFGWDYAPGVNESHYLTKAKHFWQPDWCSDDIFLSSRDAHIAFFATIGWLCNFFSLATVAWVGRIAGWVLLTISWANLNHALFHSQRNSMLTAGIFAFCCEHFAMAGEWVIGGVEGKVFGYGFLFMALSNALQSKFVWCWIYVGMAIAFHAVIGVWGLFGLIVIRACAHEELPNTPKELLAGFFGLFVALVGIIPGILAGGPSTPQEAAMAVDIQVTERLSHHLLATELAPFGVIKHFLVCAVLMLLIGASEGKRFEQLSRFTFAMLTITVGGAILCWFMKFESCHTWSTWLLRFYWFRMGDICVPLAVAFLAVRVLQASIKSLTLRLLFHSAAAIIVFVFAIGRCHEIVIDGRPGADRQSLPAYENDSKRTYETYLNWIKVCAWIRENTDDDALFITPRQQQTFKWYAHRSEVANWKDAPQDTAGIVRWHDRMSELYSDWGEEYGILWRIEPESGLLVPNDEELFNCSKKYGARYILVPQRHVELRERQGVPVTFNQVYPEQKSQRATFVLFDLSSR